MGGHQACLRTPAYFLGGIFDGSYGLDDFSANEQHKIFASDLAWTVAITSTHTLLAVHRFGLMVLGGIWEGGHYVAQGLIDLGKRMGGVGGAMVQGLGYAMDAVLFAGVQAVRIAWTISNFFLGVGLVIANAIAMPIIYGVAYIGAKVISAVVTVAKAVWSVIESIGDAIGDFFDSIFMLSEAIRLAMGCSNDVQDLMIGFRDGYIRQADFDGTFLRDYYERAPHIVASIEKREDASEVWLESYERWLAPCIERIREGDNSTAFEIFKEMYCELLSLAGVRESDGRNSRHWKRIRALT